MRIRPLLYEVPTQQDAQLNMLSNLYPEDDDTDDGEPAFGADPFDILAHKEDKGEPQ